MCRKAFDAWQNPDYSALARDTDMFAFDLDGTLARSKQPMKTGIAGIFAALTYICPVAIVSGGRLSLLHSQIVDVVDDVMNRENLHLMPTTGTRYYRWDGNGWECVFEKNIPEEDAKKAVESLNRRAAQLGLLQGETWGERIENRGSQITFSALGQNAPADIKEAWDPDASKRNALAAAVARDLPNLTVKSGGSTSVDISCKGIDKSYAICRLTQIFNIRPSRILYVGDRTDENGNDYPAVQAGTTAMHVRGPEDTVELIKGVMRVKTGGYVFDALERSVELNGRDSHCDSAQFDAFVSSLPELIAKH